MTTSTRAFTPRRRNALKAAIAVGTALGLTRWTKAAELVPTFSTVPQSSKNASADLIHRANGADRAGRSADQRWLSKVTFSADEQLTSRLASVGRERFIDEQLRMAALAPPAMEDAIGLLTALAPSTEQNFHTYQAEQQRIKDLPDDDARQQARRALRQSGNEIVRQAQQRQLLRAVLSPNQLLEQMTWFWLNHFSVYSDKGPVRWLISDYEELAIRPRALGRFRDLVMATLTAPAMLVYLDNTQSAAGKVNENYARELMELHTLGVSDGASGSSYTQQDVQEMARVLTGVGIAFRAEPPRLPPALQSDLLTRGLFQFNPARHDHGSKRVLGQVIAPSGFAEVEEAIGLLCKDPATARHIAIRLATYFVSDAPPNTLINRLATRFTQTDGDIAEVLRVLFLSPEMAASVASSTAGKLKDPMVFVVSSLRLVQAVQPIASVAPAIEWLKQLGEPLYGRVTPDGYPLTEAAWASSGQMVKRFEIGRAIGSGRAALAGQLPPGSPINPPRLDGVFFQATIEPGLGDATRQALAGAANQAERNTLLLASPEWMQR